MVAAGNRVVSESNEPGLRVPSVSFLVPAACRGLLWRKKHNKTKKGEEKESYFVCVASLFSFQAMNSREKEEREKEREEGLTKEEE